MKSVSIEGIARVDLGKKFAKQLRKDENVPCVIYGGGEAPKHFYAHSNEFRKIIYTPNVYLIDIVIGDQTVKTIIRDIQFHPVTDKILHIDFLKISDDQNVKIGVPISILGNSIGVRNGGRLRLNMRKLLIEALPENLPEQIEIDISSLQIGDVIRVSELDLENIKILNNEDDVVVGVKTARAAIEEDELEEGEEGADKPAEEGADKPAEGGADKPAEGGADKSAE